MDNSVIEENNSSISLSEIKLRVYCKHSGAIEKMLFLVQKSAFRYSDKYMTTKSPPDVFTGFFITHRRFYAFSTKCPSLRKRYLAII